MPISDCDVRDPRMKRTRKLLQDALRVLLREKALDEIGVQEITGNATVNRATFYDHYTDKFALFDAMVASDFHRLLEARNVRFDGTCPSGLAALLLAVGDYLRETQGDQATCARQDPFSPLMDAALTRSIRRVVSEGLRAHPGAFDVPVEVVASAVSGALFGAAKERFRVSDLPPGEEALSSMVRLILPLLGTRGLAGAALAAKPARPKKPRKISKRRGK